MKKTVSFPISRFVWFLSLSGLLLLSAGCPQKPQGETPKAETLMGTGAGTENQAGPEAGNQTGAEAETQAGPEAGNQTGAEAETQAGAGTGIQAETPDSSEDSGEGTSASPDASGTISQEELDKYINDDEYMFEHLKLDEPIVSDPGALVRLLPDKPLWIDKERKHVVLQGWVCQNRVMLEFFLCYGPGGIRTFPYDDETGKPAKMLQFNGPKCHESIFSTEVSGRALHTALLALGVEQGEPVKFQPEFVPPTGGKVKMTVRWRKPDGSIEEHAGQELAVDEAGNPLKSEWVFAGSLFFEDGDGEKRYAADMEGEFFGVSNFPSLILDVTEESTSSNDALIYTANEKILPERGTPVTIILEKAE